MSDAVPKCNISLYDEDSSFAIQCPQEMIVLDDKIIPEPALNMLRNPKLDPYTTEWFVEGSISGITLATVSGGGVKYTFSNAANDAVRYIYQYSFQGSIAGEQSYRLSFYAQATSPVNINMAVQIALIDVSDVGALNEYHFLTASTSLTRYEISVVAPVSANRGNVLISLSGHATSGTNSGTITFTKVQLEPEWFATQSYPSTWCGPAQTNCRQLPSSLWIRQYRKFAGFVVNPSYEGYHGNTRTINIQAVGYAWLTGTIYPDKSYTSQYDSAIIADLLSTYLVSTDPRGGTPSYVMASTANVVQGIQLASFIVARDDLKTASNNLAAQIGFYWTIDAYWGFVYAPPGYFVSPYSLICDNSSTPDMTTTFPASDFRAEVDFTQPGSNILVIGSGSNVAQVIDPVQINALGNISGYFLPTLSSWMRKVQATELNSIGDCNQRGIAELLQYSKERKLYKLTTDACELIAGQAIQVTSGTDGLNQSSLLLQSVTARWMGTDEKLQDKWEYQADLGAVNKQVQNILNRLFKSSTKSDTSPAITQTSLVIFEQFGITHGGATGYQATIMADAPLAYYRLGELGGATASDMSGNAYHGTLAGGVTLGAASFMSGSYAMIFNGTTGKIDGSAATLPSGSAAWSLEGWAKFSSISGSHINTIVSIGSWNANEESAFICVDTSGFAQIGTFGANYSSTTLIATGGWHHFAGTYDGSNMRLYVDGVLVLGPQAQTMSLTGTNVCIGSRPPPASVGNQLAGSASEIAIYNYVLSPSQIAAHYAAGS